MAVLTLRLDEQHRAKVPRIRLENFGNGLFISYVFQKSAEATPVYAIAY